MSDAETKTEGQGKAETPTETPTDGMSVEEKRFLMLALWEALIAPKWTKDDLIDFGKKIFSKKPLKEMSDEEFRKIFPFLRDVTLELGKKLTKKAEEVVASRTEAPKEGTEK